MNWLIYFFLNWSTIALQRCVNFCCTKKWFSSVYTYIPSLLDLLRPSPPFQPVMRTFKIYSVTVVLTCNSLIVILSFFSCAYWPLVCLLWRNVYSSLFFIFKIGLSFYYKVVLFIYSVYRHLASYMICECFLMCVLFFHLLDGAFFKLKYIWFTMLCKFLLYNNVTQLHTYIYSF